MITIADAAAWLAFLLAAWNAGVLGARWRDDAAVTRASEAGLFIAAALGVIAWGSWIGPLVRGAPESGLARAIPFGTAVWYRIAAAWATWHGIGLTLSMGCLAAAALAPSTRRGAPVVRQALVLTTVGLVALALVVLGLAPATPPGVLPAFLQSPAAALAPLAAMVTVFLLVVAGSLVAGAAPSTRAAPPRAWSPLVAWSFAGATISLGAEQAARAGLGIGPREAVVLGSASSGLLLWLVTAALLHHRAERLLWPAALRDRTSSGRRLSAAAAHVGAVMIAASFAAHVAASRTTLELPPGQPVQATDGFGRDWTLVNQGVSRFDADGADVTALAVEARAPDAEPVLVSTSRFEYPVGPGQALVSTHRGSAGGSLQVVRLLVEEFGGDTARVRVTFLPLPVLWNGGLVLLVLSAALLVVADRGRSTSYEP